MLIGEIYRIPNSNCIESIQNYENIVNRIQYEKKDVVIVIDQNIDYLKCKLRTF